MNVMDAFRVGRGCSRRRHQAIELVLLVVFLLAFGPPPAWGAEADSPCAQVREWWYEAPAFTIRVVDKETGQPLADVHALAAWEAYGAFSHRAGPLMVLDAVSGPDGVLSFPAWGPIQGYCSGLVLGSDPIITLFKPGYVLIPPRGTNRAIYNIYPRLAEETDRVHRFGEDGRTVEMAPFRGTPEEWLEELGGEFTFVFLPSVGLADKRPLLNRVRRVWAEREKYPTRYQAPEEFFWHVGRRLKDLEGEGR